MKNFESALKYISDTISCILEDIPDEVKEKTYEIRLRAGKSVSLFGAYGTAFVNKKAEILFDSDLSISATLEDIKNTFNRICEYSVYAHQQEINNGYMPMENGNRAGVCGSAVCEKNSIFSVKDITSVNIRIAREIIGCADNIIGSMGDLTCSYIIAGPPGCGKTTVTRDIIRQLSGSKCGYKKTAVIDERCEFSGVINGKATNDIGVTSDIFDSYPKNKAIEIAIRAFSPDYIVCDEIATEDDIEAVKFGLNRGVNFILTIHCGYKNDLLSHSLIREMFMTDSFEKLFLLGNGKNLGKVIKELEAGEFNNEIPYCRSYSNGGIIPSSSKGEEINTIKNCC